ncbi:choice-of-anchor D domain-containing protein [Desulfococcaceae bacterium HSG8]|nr:choice-of-anchor D domain-containing protein [Desulfococcaceae bacterium HSG8]
MKKILFSLIVAAFLCSGFAGDGSAQNLKDELLKNKENSLKKRIEKIQRVSENKKKNSEKKHSSREWFSSAPEDLEVLMGTIWDLVFTIDDTTFTHTISFGSEAKKDSDGYVYLECYGEQNDSGRVYWTDITELDGLAFRAFVSLGSLTMYYEFKVNGDRATGVNWGYNEDEEAVSNSYPLSGIRQEPDISVTPISFEYPESYVEESGTRTFTIQNSGTKDLEIETLSISGTNASEFGLQNDNCSGQLLTASGTCTFDVVFTPVSSGEKHGKINIPSDDPNIPVINASLSGTAVDKPAWFSSDPEDLEVLMGTTWDFTFTIGDTMFTDTITFGSGAKKDSDGDVYLECYDQQNKPGYLYWTDGTELDGLAFRAFVYDSSVTMYYDFKINGDTATGIYWHHNADDDTFSDACSLSGTRRNEIAVDKPRWSSWILGDVNNSGKIDLVDASLALQSAADTVLLSPVYTEADINEDNEINLEEVIYVLKVLCGEFVNNDNDGDGYTPGEGDCNDNDAGIHPQATEICDDGIDQDCKFGDCLTITEGTWYGDTDDSYVTFTVRQQAITVIKWAFISGEYWIETQIDARIPYSIDNNAFYVEHSDTVVTGTFTDSLTCEVTYHEKTFPVTFSE